MMGYIRNRSKIWHLWGSVAGCIIQASNLKFNETLLAGKRIIDKLFRDTLKDLANPESQSVDLIEDESIDTSAKAIPSGLLIGVQ